MWGGFTGLSSLITAFPRCKHMLQSFAFYWEGTSPRELCVKIIPR